MPNEPKDAAGPSRPPTVGGGIPNELGNAAGPSRPPTVGGGIPNELDAHSPTANAPGSDARPSGQPAVAMGAMDVDPPAGQTTTDDEGTVPPSRQVVLLMGPGNAGPPAGMQGTSPAGWIATQPATQRMLPASQSQVESMEIEDALRRPSSPPTGTEDAPMDVDDWEEPKSRKRSSKSKRSKAPSSRRVDSSGPRVGPPWTQADPTTPPRAGSKHKPHSSPDKSPRTEKRHEKMARRDAGRGRRVPETDSEDDLNIGAIARIKQEGEPSRVPDDGEDFTSLIANLSDLSESDQQPSSDEDPLAAQQVRMSQSATAQPEEHVPKVNLPAPRPPRGRGGGGRARGRK